MSNWYEVIGEQTIADAILDRIIYDEHRLELKGKEAGIAGKRELKCIQNTFYAIAATRLTFVQNINYHSPVIRLPW